MTIVLVHGLIHTCRHLRSASDEVVHVVDLPGYGDNDPGSATSIDRAVDDVCAYVTGLGAGPVHLAGHSVGGAVVMCLAARHPGLVSSIINIEGNLTLADAFWSARIAKQPAGRVEVFQQRSRSDPATWLQGQGIPVRPELVERAALALEAQNGRTLQSMAASVVEVTGQPEYLASVREVVARGVPIHLVAGARSADGWAVPDDIRAAAASSTVLPDVGHLMMLEDPRGFVEVLGRLAQAHRNPGRHDA